MSTPASPLMPAPKPSQPRRDRRVLLRGLGLAAAATVIGGVVNRDRLNDTLVPGPAEPRASCVAPGSLPSHTTIGRARLVYEVDGKANSFRFEPAFHRQLVAWLSDWEAHTRHRGTTEIWTYGAHVNKDDCHSWHAAGRAFDISRMRAGSRLLVSAREDLWHEVSAARRQQLERGYWALAASLNLHFTYVLSYHFDAAHRNHLHIDNGVSGSGKSLFDKRSRVQNQTVQQICTTLWGQQTPITGEYDDTQRAVAPVLKQLDLGPLTRQQNWQAFLRASVPRG